MAEKAKHVSMLVVLVFSPFGNLAEVGSVAQLGNMIKTWLDRICTLTKACFKELACCPEVM